MVRSTRLAGPQLLDVAGAVLYTVPLGRTAIVKSVRIVNGSDATETVRMCIGDELLDNALLWDTPVPADRVFSDTTWWVLNAEETLWVSASADNALAIAMSGALLGSTT